MRILRLFATAVSLFFVSMLQAQSHFPGYFAVSFTDKSGTPYSVSEPEKYLSQKAVDRRMKQNIAIDSSDLPVNPAYLTALNQKAAVKYSSRWQNSALATINDSAAYLAVKAMSFVSDVDYLGPVSKKKKTKASSNIKLTNGYEPVIDSFPDYGLSRNQLDLIGLTPLHHAGYNGSGIEICILDAGFHNVDKVKAFSDLRNRGGIIIAKDFVNPGNNVYKEHSHGAYVLSTIAGILPEKYYGAAPGAEFILLRTEDVNSEFPVEEYYWLAGAEYADSAGADIITSSLSYTQFDDTTLNHTHGMLNGETTIVSRAAATAFKKGIVVFTSAGNDGNKPWQKIGFPGDADGVLTIGAVDSLGNYATLSSKGYTADGRVKPDVVAVGQATALISGNDKVFYGNGTSFSTPTLAGAVATLMQANPQTSALKIREAVIQSAHDYLKPDSLTGYGIPDIFVANMIIRGLPEKDKENNNLFKIIPNPFSNGFYLVSAPADSQEVKISLWNISGKNLWQTTFRLTPQTSVLYIDKIANAANGLYFIKIENGDKVFTEKIIKQR